jgi:hypothetical protein
MKPHLNWAIDNDVKIELVCKKNRPALVVSKDGFSTSFSLDSGIGFDLAQHLLFPAIEAIRHEINRNPEENQS